MIGIFCCSFCGADWGAHLKAHRCTSCGRALDFVGERAPSFPRERIRARPATMWRYQEALPAFAEPVSLGEPMTPLIPLQVGGIRALAKCEYTLPTGSYKDRGAALLVSYLKSMGVSQAVEDSSGNAGASLAAYAARAGMRLKVFCPSSASPGKLAQIRLYGAELVPVEGPRPRATEALLEYAEKTSALYASHLWHPLFIEGVKTMAFEIVEQLDWQAPDWVLCPVGAGSILLGLYRGFRDLQEAKAIQGLPRLVAIQAQNVSPVYRAFREGALKIAPMADPQPTLAEGIALPAPVRPAEILQALRQSSGTVVAVSEEEIAEGLRGFGQAGFCVEPTSAVVWKGLEKLRGEEGMGPDEKVVLILSGHGLKAASALAALLG